MRTHLLIRLGKAYAFPPAMLIVFTMSIFYPRSATRIASMDWLAICGDYYGIGGVELVWDYLWSTVAVSNDVGAIFASTDVLPLLPAFEPI